MPWQSAPGFMIICGAFTLTGVGLSAVDRLETGRVSISLMPFSLIEFVAYLFCDDSSGKFYCF